ncbi:enoyl-CoA hydratase/isomerase family protein [Sphingomonas immobilis]|uniref:Enoyl-CoA hydratase-related protein n=1 Tax=Sphingomonas immobilis TaxID=3063997 RepID=A0ABT8ZXB0_9SPHN|nr:enoyl-CoA hydratase-related protein [Sphingomonas sp. CA1-15]MDO7842198.1 enoyl-CoA hydratase-related protein [Sphingomonas sp. CA1-15]
MSAEPTVLTARDGAVVTVTLNRPERRNGLAGDMLERLFETLSELARDATATVVVLRGAGEHFCVGADIKAYPDGVKGKTDFAHVARLYHISTLLHEMPQVTIAAIDGSCAGAGLGWAAACDFRFASDRVVFATAFLKVGVAGDMGTAWSLVQAVGPARARELMFFPEKFGAEDARGYGLVTRIFAPAALHAETARLAQELAGRSRLALAAMKANFLSVERVQGLRDYIDIEGARHTHIVQSDETTASFRAFADGAGKTA